MHHDVDFGVGSSTSNVACHNLNFVHNACWVVTHQVNNLSASESQWFTALDPPKGYATHRNHIQQIYTSNRNEELVTTAGGFSDLKLTTDQNEKYHIRLPNCLNI